MSRSLRVRQNCIPKVKSAVQRNGYPRQKDLAEDVGCSLATASNFLNGKQVDFTNFIEICDRLGLDWKDIAVFGSNGSTSTIVAENVQPLEDSDIAFPNRGSVSVLVKIWECRTDLLITGMSNFLPAR